MADDSQPLCRLVTVNGALISATRATRTLGSGRMKSHQQIQRNIIVGRLRNGSADLGPVFGRDPTTLPPLLDLPQRFVDRFGKVNTSTKGFENSDDASSTVSFHEPVLSSDRLSSQDRTGWAMTSQASKRTMCPMGKATTPAKFKRDFCRRVRAARILAGLTQGEAAERFGLKEDTYSKYERRSPMPHYLIPRACGLFGVAPDELYGLRARADLDQEYEDIRRTG